MKKVKQGDEFKVGDTVRCKPGFERGFIKEGFGGMDYKPGLIGVINSVRMRSVDGTIYHHIGIKGHSSLFSAKCLELYTPEEKPETLLEKAARLYPIGTKYIGINADGMCNTRPSTVTHKPKSEKTRSPGRGEPGCRLAIWVGDSFIYYNGKWAAGLNGVKGVLADEIPKDWHYKVTEANLKDCKAWLDAKGGKFNGKKSSERIKVGNYILPNHRTDNSYYFGNTNIKKDSHYDSHKELTDTQFKLVLERDVPKSPPKAKQPEGHVLVNGVTKEQLTRANTAFHCKTEKEARLLLDTAHALGLEWFSGVALNEETHLISNLSYNFEPGAFHAPKSWYLDNGYTIIEVSDLIPRVGEELVTDNVLDIDDEGWITHILNPIPGISEDGHMSISPNKKKKIYKYKRVSLIPFNETQTNK